MNYISWLENKKKTHRSLTLRKEHGHGLPQYTVEARYNEHLFGGDHIVHQHVRQYRTE